VDTVLFLATYRVKPFLPLADQRHLLELFEKHGAAPGTIAHYVAADASTGWTVIEAEDAVDAYATILKYEEYMQFEMTPILTIDEALPHLLEAMQ
jgi:Protein of unknown function (DUF3303)